MSLITCKGLSFAYDGVTVVHNLNFKVEPGDYLCIVGENGAGKSTLVKGLLQLKSPSQGSITYGEGLTASQIGYLPQQTQVQRDFPASVREVVLSGCLGNGGFHPFYTKKDREKAEKNMEALKITDLKDRCYRDLSGGQQQRVLLARALCATQKLLLLDEPASGLDPVVTKSLYELVERINARMGITVIMVSHDMAAALAYSSHVLHMGSDRQLFFGTSENYRRSSAYHSFMGSKNAARIWRHENAPVRRRREERAPETAAPEQGAAIRTAQEAYRKEQTDRDAADT